MNAVVSQSAAIPESRISKLVSPTTNAGVGQLKPLEVVIIGAEVSAVMPAQTAKRLPMTGRCALSSAAPAARGIKKIKR